MNRWTDRLINLCLTLAAILMAAVLFILLSIYL